MKKRVRNFFSDFKKFISKGNIMDLAVAVIIGGAFGKIVTSLVNDIIMPLVTGAIGVNTITELSWVIRKAVVENGEIIQPALTINWGSFLQNIIDFLIISFFVFLAIRMLSVAKNVAGKIAEEAKETAEKIAAEARELLERKGLSGESATQEDIAALQSAVNTLEAAATGTADTIATESSDALSTQTTAGLSATTANVEALLVEIRDLIKGK
ncbi:MAG: large conductance mechanosensitive channel protein MscL [Clostridia bacterium]